MCALIHGNPSQQHDKPTEGKKKLIFAQEQMKEFGHPLNASFIPLPSNDFHQITPPLTQIHSFMLRKLEMLSICQSLRPYSQRTQVKPEFLKCKPDHDFGTDRAQMEL